MDPHWEKGLKVLDELRFEIAQLDLLASGPVRQAAGDLFKAHLSERGRLILRARPGQDDYSSRQEARVKFEELHEALVERVRA